jgi:hypothetical protein
MTRRNLVVLLAAGALAACAGRVDLAPIPPSLYQAAGDTAVFGKGPVALDPYGRMVALELRAGGTVFLYSMDRQFNLRLLEARPIEPGFHRLSPYRPGTRAPAFRPAYNALLVVVTEEEWGGGIPSAALVRTLSPDYALNAFPASLLRRRSAAWAAWLVQALPDGGA